MELFKEKIDKLEDMNNITCINATSGSFDFLIDEPEIYSVSDLRKKYTSK